MPTNYQTEWRSCEETMNALDLEGKILGVTLHQGYIGFKTARNAEDQDAE